MTGKPDASNGSSHQLLWVPHLVSQWKRHPSYEAASWSMDLKILSSSSLSVFSAQGSQTSGWSGSRAQYKI